ncbi:MAG: FecR domain-containing protein [Dysgonamonadaceae bacterium]|jgi:hypothetical protein|nr:FecR domain-containing protein [Dysgonamonadaceae bacterium]
MKEDYSYYKRNNYLEDDFFVRSILFPTKETRLFWNELVNSRTIDVDEYIEACMILDTWKKNRSSVPAFRVDQLWERISDTRESMEKQNRKALKIKNIRTFCLIAAACCALLLMSSLFLFAPKQPEPTMAKKELDPQYQIINKQQTQKEIVIMTGHSEVKVTSDNPEVSYNKEGVLAIDNEHAQSEEVIAPVKPTLNQLHVPFGKRAQLKLSDGSRLWVNTGTTVIYPVVFAGNKREIFVDGEIYAEVRHDADKPFVVKTDSLEIVVYGTEFNLSAYKEEAVKQVVLISGSVEVKQHGSHVRMEPRQSYTTGQENPLRKVNTDLYTSWRDGVYIFENEPIEHILLKLARYYNVTMVIPKQPSGIFCYGKLELKDELPVLLSGLMEVASFNFSEKEKQYIIQFK